MKGEKIKDFIEELNLPIDYNGWGRQNEKDYNDWMTGNGVRVEKELLFDHYEFDGSGLKKYEVEYILIDKGFIPCITKSETNEEGQTVSKLVQIGRLLSGFEYDRYLLRKCERAFKKAKENKTVIKDTNNQLKDNDDITTM